MLKQKLKTIAEIGEKVLSLVVFAGIITYSLNSAIYFQGLDWSSIEVFYDFINFVLVIAVGFELIKLLVTHNIFAIVDLLTFVVARKVLRPDLSSYEVLLAIVAFSILYTLKIKVIPQK